MNEKREPSRAKCSDDGRLRPSDHRRLIAKAAFDANLRMPAPRPAASSSHISAHSGHRRFCLCVRGGFRCVATYRHRRFSLLFESKLRAPPSRQFPSGATLTPQTLDHLRTSEGKTAHGDFAMTLQNAICKASPSGRRVRLPSCPQCADTLLAPLLAEHVSASLVHNHWVCESCGHSYRDSFTFADVEDDELVS